LTKISRRRFLKTGAVVLGVGAVATSVDATVFEPNEPVLVRIEVPIRSLPPALEGFKIIQLSDFHYDEHFSVNPIRKAIAMANRLDADLMVLTGDFVTIPMWADFVHNAKRDSAAAAEPCAQLLTGLRSKFGSIAILGNHDRDSDLQRVLEALRTNGITALQNANTHIEQDGSRLWLCGIDDIIEGKPDIQATLRGVPENEPTILLVHEPDFADEVKRLPIDLQLSGHSHGGQIRFPLIGAPVLPQLAHKYPWGFHRFGRLSLYTNIGLGTIRVPMRFDCPPEVTFITLRGVPAG
jgi:predicted MPP superfamily phosphohydrolase